MRVKRGNVKIKRHKKILKQAKGYRGSLGRLYRTTKEAVTRGMVYAYRDRRRKKRDFRALWIVRINAAVREAGLSYSRFINNLQKKNILLNRKMLADIAFNDADAFSKLIEFVQK